MRIAIDINNVLRDTLGKIQDVYEKWYIDNPYVDESVERKVISDVTTLNIFSHLLFNNEDEVYDFLYKEYTMEIFGHAGSTEMSGMMDFNDFYLEMRDNHDIIVVSDEIGKSKPASLFFLSKFGCLVETIKFYSEQTKNQMWDSIDVLLTANPDLLLNKPENKFIIKYITKYNSDIKSEYEIKNIKELKEKITQIYDKSFK
jgi:hypothetical protein